MSPATLPTTVWLPCTAALVASASACWLLARLAPRLGWVDAGDGTRKPQREPLPLVGGAAVALALALGWALGASPGRGLEALLQAWVDGSPRAWDLHLGTGVPAPWVGAGLLASFAVGLVDDLLPGGLRPRLKLAGQAAAGLVLAWPLLTGGAAGLGLLLVLGALVAMNALNTYDNADGAASGLVLVALAPVAPVASAALAGVLPFNVRRVDGRALVGRLPRAILGDAGSHLLGMLVLLTPAAWPALALPLFDLARVCLERVRAGQRPWVGDRRHLAHRLERRGGAPLLVLAALLLVAAPSALLGHAPRGAFSAELALLGVVATATLFVLAVLLSRAVQAPRAAAGRAELGLGA